MLNPFVIKKYAALILAGFLPLVFFTVGMTYYGFLMALGIAGLGIILSVVIANPLLSNPFRAMTEGKGVLALNIDSTGLIRPFIMGVHSPYLKGKIGKEPVNDVFDRSTVMGFAPPRKTAKPLEIKQEGGIKIDLTEEQYNKARFGLFHYPVVIYNAQIKSIVTKDFLSNEEKETFAEHGVLYLNRKMEELTSVVRDFGRHVVELTKPKANLLQNKWFWIIIIILFVVLALLFLPAVITSFTKGLEGSGGLGNILNSGKTIMPR